MSTEEKELKKKKGFGFSSVALGVLMLGASITIINTPALLDLKIWKEQPVGEGKAYSTLNSMELSEINKKLDSALGGKLPLVAAAKTSVPGLYLVMSEFDQFYFHPDSGRFIRGDIYNSETKKNETQIVSDILKKEAELKGHTVTIKGAPVSTSINKESKPEKMNLGSSLKDELNKLKNSTDVKKEIASITPASSIAIHTNSSEQEKADARDETPQEVIDEQLKGYGGEKVSADMAKYSLNGRVNPEEVTSYRTYIKYKDKVIPKIGFDKDGKELSPEVTKKQIQAIVKFVEKAGDRWSVVYKAENEKASMVIFTDPTCPFCRKLHSEVEDYTKNGISVYYLFYPRYMGLGLEDDKLKHSVRLMDSIWYNKDRNKAADDVYAGYRAEGEEVMGDIQNPVFEHYLIGEMIGVRGTPKIIMSNGETMEGYLNWKYIAKKALK
ncbi:hypothetical protein BS028_23925 [Vibrio parahaemolyticus]|nr:hypothetical protein [Vibrio parahaemolyticus]